MNKHNNAAIKLGIAAFILSLLGLACLMIVVFIQISGFWYSAGCLVFSVTALILSAVSRKKQSQSNPLALTGFIVSIVTLVLFVILWILVIALFFFLGDVMHMFSGLGQIG